MSVEQRPEMIVAAALPLSPRRRRLATSQIARSAGIGEATIFRAFTDKEELLGAWMAEAVRPDHAIREIPRSRSTSRWTRASSRPPTRWART